MPPLASMLTDLKLTSTRGWVVQERILSRRTLRFGSTLSWECRQSAVSELDPSERGMWDFGNELPLCTSFYQRVIDPQQPHDEPPRPEDKQKKDVRKLWDSIVSEFSRADLTVLLDRQAAILGLVSAIALRTGWKHLAGFWWPLTIRDLAWTVSAGITERRRTGLSPSWSWLSITGGVDLARVSASEFSVAEIEGVDDEDRTVSVRLSCIRLRLGPLRDGSHEAPEGWPSFDFFVWEDLLDSLPDEVYVLPLVLTTGSEYSEVEGILVTPSRACLGAHERVGSFTHEMWDDAARAKMAPIFEILHDVSRRETVILV